MPTSPSAASLLDRLAAAWPVAVWSDVPVLVAVSGGSDSVALLCALHRLAPPGHQRLHVAHFNHQLRGPDSDDDERLVVELARSLGLECHVGRGAVREQAACDGDGIEAAARSQRYTFLEKTAAVFGARYVVTAHTANDQAETILHRIVRGTGIAGLAGIPRVRQLNESCSLVRPVLEFRREELRAWLAEIGRTYRDDASNLDRSYTRNRIRHDLIPQLAREYNSQVLEALLRLGQLADGAQALIDSDVDGWLQGVIVEQTPARVVLKRLDESHVRSDFVLRESLIAVWQRQGWPLQAMTFEHWQRLVAIWRGEPIGEPCFPSGIVVGHRQDHIVITRAINTISPA